MRDVGYANDLQLVSNAQTETKHSLRSLELEVRDPDLYVNANIKEFMRFKREIAFSTLYGWPLNLIHKFKYLGSNISSNETDVNTHLVKA